MAKAKRPLAFPALAAVLLPLIALAASAPPASARTATGASSAGRAAAFAPPALRLSRELWATIDVCSPADQSNWVGIRGSMPGDGHAHETMFMRFRLQLTDPITKQWVDLANGASDFIAVGTAKVARQAGHSFQLVPPAGKPAFTLRGVVSFQWRKGARMIASISRPTRVVHERLLGADPPQFSTATCQIG